MSPPKSRKSYPKRKPLDRVRIDLKGHHNTADLRKMLNEAVDKIEAMAISHCGTPMTGSVLYLKLSDHRGDPLTDLGQYSDVLKDGITISAPYPCDADERGI